MRLKVILEVLTASTITHKVESKFEQRGGMMLVAPPGHLKTAILKVVAQAPGIKGMTDITIHQLGRMRDEIAGGRVHTLVFYDVQKLYERKYETALNVIGGMRALVDEGFTVAGTDDQMVSEVPARALVLGAGTPTFFRKHMAQWAADGFARRFLFPTFHLANHDTITDAILEERPIRIRNTAMTPLGTLPMNVSRADAYELRRIVANQYGDETPLIMLKKILTVLRWRRREMHAKDDAMDVLMEFAQSLGEKGTKLVIEESDLK